MSKIQSSYRQIIKATALFGGVQLISIIVAVIKSKAIAILLGPTGMGIAGLLTSTAGLIGGLTNFGLGTSAVKNVAEANGTNDDDKIATIIIILRRCIWGTGLLGMAIMILGASSLSRYTFGNLEYTSSFLLISISVLFTQLAVGQRVIMQGMRELKSLAQATLIGGISALIITLPIYFIFGIQGIAIAIVCASIINFVVTWYFARKFRLNRAVVSLIKTIREGKEMISMGFMISLGGIITLSTSYGIKIFISHVGEISDVGLYDAGFTIINTYVSMIFVAMGTDYYPRLAAISNNNVLCRETINQQAEIAILVLAPIVTIFLVFSYWFIVILYSDEFLAIESMVRWAALGMFFKASTWAIGFLLLAKGATKLFFLSEFFGNIYILIFNLAGYYFMGFTGLGISFIIGYIFYLIQIYYICKINYNFFFSKIFIKIFTTHFLLTTSFLIALALIEKPYSYISGAVFICISGLYSYRELDKKIGLKQFITNYLKKQDPR